MNKSILAFMNAYTRGKSGADMCFIEIFKRFKYPNVSIVTSQLGKQLVQKNELSAKYYITTREKTFQNVIQTYVKRILSGVIVSLKSAPPDILYVTSDTLPDIVPALTIKIRDKRVVWVQKIFHLIPKQRRISHFAQKMSFFVIKRFADIIIIDNDSLMKELRRQDFPMKKVYINHLGIDLPYFKSIVPTKRSFDAVFMGRLHSSKGIFDLISIWRTIVDKISHAKLAIIGTGDRHALEKLKRTIRRAGLQKNIQLLGYLENEAAFSLIKSSKVFLFPSHEEGFGLVIGEVMACGVPIVAYDLPMYQNTFKKGMRTVHLGRIDLFSSSVLDLLREKKERIKLIKIGSSCVKRFTWSSTVKKELRILFGQKSIGSFNRTY